jgi:hypothetical protein
VEGRGVAGGKCTARGPGAWIRFANGAGQGLRPPGPAPGRRAAPGPWRPCAAGGGGRVNIAAVACLRPGRRPHLFYKLRAYRRRKGEPRRSPGSATGT